jgi:hypothetical protein
MQVNSCRTAVDTFEVLERVTNRTRKTGDTFPDLRFPIYRGCANMNYDRNAISSQLPVPDLPIVSTILLVREALRSDTSGSVGRRV